MKNIIKTALLVCVCSITLISCASTPPKYLNTEQHAFYNNDLSAIDQQVDSKNINSPIIDSTGHSDKQLPLYAAAQLSNVETLRFLIKKGADINQVNPHSGTNALFGAIWGGKIKNLKYLLENGASVETLSSTGRTPLAQAVAINRYEMQAILKEYGAEINQSVLNVMNEPATISTNDKAENTDSGFNWGKALALGAGAIAGGGLSLDSETQAGVISGIVLDSQANTSGTSNLDTAVQTSLENNAQRAAASTSLPSSSKGEVTTDTNPAPQNNNPSDTVGQAQTAGSATTSSIANPTPNSSNAERKCGVSSFTLAEEQAEKDRLGAIMQSKLVNVPAYDYKTRNQAWRDWGAALDDWRKARHEACGIDTSRTSRVTIE